ncbi:MAG: glycosyltransferase family 1 protein [Candidatus Binatia bacterium]
MTRIALDGWPLQVRSAGVAVYVAELVRALAAAAPTVDWTLLGWRGLAVPPAPDGARWRRAWRYPLVMGVPPGVPRLAGVETLIDDADAFHATAYALPRARRTPLVLTVHDLALLRYPGLGTPALRRTLAAVSRRAAEARLVIADSRATADDVVALCGVPAARVRVVPLGVAPAFAPQPEASARAHVARRFGLDAPYLLHVGTLEPRKNLPRLIAACAALWRGGALAQPLVLAGADGWGADAVARAVAEIRGARRVIRLGRVAAVDLPPLYAAADALLFPSLYEGFGLPALEAMACGTPVLAGRAGALPGGRRRRRARRSDRRRGPRRRRPPPRRRRRPARAPGHGRARAPRPSVGRGRRAKRWPSTARWGRRHGVTVNWMSPVPATFDHGPHPASLLPAQVAPAGQARTMPL